MNRWSRVEPRKKWKSGNLLLNLEIHLKLLFNHYKQLLLEQAKSVLDWTARLSSATCWLVWYSLSCCCFNWTTKLACLRLNDASEQHVVTCPESGLNFKAILGCLFVLRLSLSKCSLPELCCVQLRPLATQVYFLPVCWLLVDLVAELLCEKHELAQVRIVVQFLLRLPPYTLAAFQRVHKYTQTAALLSLPVDRFITSANIRQRAFLRDFTVDWERKQRQQSAHNF